MDHDDVVVVSVGSRAREDDGEDDEDEVLMCDHGGVTPGTEAMSPPGHGVIVCWWSRVCTALSYNS